MQTQLLLPILGSVRRVLKKLLDSDTAVGSPSVLREWLERKDVVDVLIPVEGTQLGGFVISATRKTADGIAAELLHSRGAVDNKRARNNALLEFARMVSGIAHRDERTEGLLFLPPTLADHCAEAASLTRLRPWIVIPITTRFGSIQLAASLRAAASMQQANACDGIGESTGTAA